MFPCTACTPVPRTHVTQHVTQHAEVISTAWHQCHDSHVQHALPYLLCCLSQDSAFRAHTRHTRNKVGRTLHSHRSPEASVLNDTCTPFIAPSRGRHRRRVTDGMCACVTWTRMTDNGYHDSQHHSACGVSQKKSIESWPNFNKYTFAQTFAHIR